VRCCCFFSRIVVGRLCYFRGCSCANGLRFSCWWAHRTHIRSRKDPDPSPKLPGFPPSPQIYLSHPLLPPFYNIFLCTPPILPSTFSQIAGAFPFQCWVPPPNFVVTCSGSFPLGVFFIHGFPARLLKDFFSPNGVLGHFSPP